MSKKQEMIAQIGCFRENREVLKAELEALLKVFYQIPDDNISEQSQALVTEDGISIVVIHTNDGFRVVEITVRHDFIKTSACFMPDSFLYQLKGRSYTSEQEQDFYEAYFNAIFSDAFAKEIHYRKKNVVKTDLVFDDERFKSRSYVSFPNKIKASVFGLKSDKVEKFRYLSFFKMYDYNVKNVYL